jgi:WD40 repeat protein
MSRGRFAAVLALVALGACTEEKPPPVDPPTVPPVSSAAPFRPCGAIGAGALAVSALSPDGSVLAAATLSGQLVLYRRADGSRLHTFWDLPGQQVGVAFSSDGKRLAAASRTETRVWSFPDLTPVRTFTRPHSDRTMALALSPDGAYIATGGFDGNASETAIVRIWSVADGSLQGSWQRLFEQGVRALAFSPDGTRLAFATGKGVAAINVPDASGPRGFGELFGGQLAWSKDGALLASGGVVVRVDTGTMVKDMEVSTVHDASAFSPDGRFYADALMNEVKVYRVSDWTKLHTFREEGATHVSNLAFTPDSAELIVDLGVNAFWCNASGQRCQPWGNKVRFHQVQAPGIVSTLSLGPAITGDVVFSPDGSLLAANADGVLGLWRTSDLSPVAAPAIEDPWRIQFSPDTSQLRVSHGIYERSSGQQVHELPFLATLSPDFRLTAHSEGRQILVSDVASGDPRMSFPMEGTVTGFSPDSRYAVVFSHTEGYSLRLLDVTTGRVARTFEQEFNVGGPIPGFSPDGRWLTSTSATAFSSVEVRGLDGETGTASLEGGFAAAFSPDSTVLATGGTGPGVRLWRTSGFTLREELLGHGTYTEDAQWPMSIVAAAFATTGQLATVGADRTVRLWCSP